MKVSAGSWVEFAAATHVGYCPDCPTQRTGPAWDWIDHVSDSRSALHVAGAHGDGQCGGCGGLNRGWVTGGARDLTGVDVDEVDAVLEEMVAEVAKEVDARQGRRAAQIRRDLLDELAQVVASGVTEAEDEDEDDDAVFDRLRAAGVYVRRGTDTEPGILKPSWTRRLSSRDGWSAWDLDPRQEDIDEVTEVFESDLDSA